MFKMGRADLATAIIAHDHYRSIPLRLIEPDMQMALEIAWQHKIYAYDAYVLETARQLDIPLLTLDQPLLKTAKKMGLKILTVENTK